MKWDYSCNYLYCPYFQEMRVVLETMECFVMLAQTTIRQPSPHISLDLMYTACVLHGEWKNNTDLISGHLIESIWSNKNKKIHSFTHLPNWPILNFKNSNKLMNLSHYNLYFLRNFVIEIQSELTALYYIYALLVWTISFCLSPLSLSLHQGSYICLLRLLGLAA